MISTAQEIDRIDTDSAALSFVKKQSDQNGTVHLSAPKPLLSSSLDSLYTRLYNIKCFEKADFDNNGFTDLLFNGYLDTHFDNLHCERISLVILSFGRDSFQVKNISGEDHRAFSAGMLINSGDRPAGIHMVQANFEWARKENLFYISEKKDTLGYAYDHFIENIDPSSHIIEKIKFSFSPGLILEWKFYTMTFTADTAWLESEVFQEDKICTRKYFMRVNTALWQRLTGLLNQINFPRLKDNYSINQTCNSTGYLFVKYDNAQMKSVKDYGLSGTYGLKAIQELLMETEASPLWQLLDETDASGF